MSSNPPKKATVHPELYRMTLSLLLCISRIHFHILNPFPPSVPRFPDIPLRYPSKAAGRPRICLTCLSASSHLRFYHLACPPLLFHNLYDTDMICYNLSVINLGYGELRGSNSLKSPNYDPLKTRRICCDIRGISNYLFSIDLFR